MPAKHAKSVYPTVELRRRRNSKHPKDVKTYKVYKTNNAKGEKIFHPTITYKTLQFPTKYAIRST